MSRIQLALNVDDLEAAIGFYSTLLNATPAKIKPGYANFALEEPALKLVLIQNAGQGGSLNHLGIEVDSSQTVHAEIGRLSGAGMFTEEQINTTCCFAAQDKVWVTAPDGEPWEIYTVLADAEEFGQVPPLLADEGCCGNDSGSAAAPCCTPTAG
ncbi:VOC family protein [Gordonia sp. PP30]|uniref:ArsI/CadI family heavy metal resistance metalloenzyme n=1 Tax=unclassified Gordonia (in: high G+C Gram-positive bacteria) TaxID=2657482 RepID=UPI001FFF9513|nr:ArsI/CadI family heavy metal resistance metalloenzyme [Gordonia sp. PP30]UQE76826.1 VOC family protein [Gordonia sp. PP30]